MSGETENQYFLSMMPSSISICSNRGASRRKAACSSSEQNPMTFSTPPRLYHERSKSTISPAVGRCVTYRWKYHCPRSRSVGAGSATARTDLGLRYSVIRLMTPPFPSLITTFEDDCDPSAGLLDPCLELEELDLQAIEFGFVGLLLDADHDPPWRPSYLTRRATRSRMVVQSRRADWEMAPSPPAEVDPGGGAEDGAGGETVVAVESARTVALIDS